MAHDTDVGARWRASLWRRPLAGGRSLDSWLDARTERLLHAIARLESDPEYLAEHLRRLKGITSDPRVAEALRVANLPEERHA